MITSPQNPKIELARKLSLRKFREREGKCLLEGIRTIGEALDAGASLLYGLYAGKLTSTEAGRALYSRLVGEGVKLFPVEDQVLAWMSDTETSQGILVVAEKAEASLEEVLGGGQARPDSLILVACEIQDPGNLGTMIRTCYAGKCTGILITKGSVDPYNPKVLRSAMGAVFRVPVVELGEPEEISSALDRLKSGGVKLVAACGRAEKYCFDFDYTSPVAIMVGNEARGLARGILEQADERLAVPMPGGAESLNAAIAASIFIYEATRQRLMAARKR